MNTLYILYKSNTVDQEKLVYLLNNSPELCGEKPPVNNVDEYTAFPDSDFEWYNPEIKELTEINDLQLDGLLNIVQDKNAAVILDAENVQDIFNWSRGTPVILVDTVLDDQSTEKEVDRVISQSCWTDNSKLNTLWEKLGVSSPSAEWIEKYTGS